MAENAAVVHGWSDASIRGIAEASPHEGPPLADDDRRLSRGRSRSRSSVCCAAGHQGPYGLLLGREEYTRVIEIRRARRLSAARAPRKILDGPLVWAPGVSGGVVLSLRGGDFLFESGQDLAVGYDHHDADAVHLYLQESFSFVVATPEAAVALAAPAAGAAPAQATR